VAAMRVTGRSADEVRQELARTVPNLFAQVLALNDTLRLALDDAQKAALAARADSFGARLAPMVDSLAAAVATEERSPNGQAVKQARARKTELVRAAQALLDQARQELREVLTREQWGHLPAAVQMPASQIVTARRGIDTRRGDW